jgi:hypothetical protein
MKTCMMAIEALWNDESTIVSDDRGGGYVEER